MGQMLCGEFAAFLHQPLNKFGYSISSDGTGLSTRTGAAVFAVNTWHHVCFMRIAKTFKLYVDGVHEAAADLYVGTDRHNSSADFTLGHTLLGFNGYAAEMRFTKHQIPFNPAGFTPPNRMH